jgi:hypothetical protein
MNRLSRALLLALLLLTGACSMKAAIEKLSSPEDRAFARQFVDDVRRGNDKRLEFEFDPELWTKSATQLPKARPLFPKGEGETRLIGYHVSANFTNGAGSTTKEYSLVTSDNSHWTTTTLVTLAQGGPARIVSWNVQGFAEPPPEVKTYDSLEAAAPWIQAGAVVLLLAMAGLIWWLVRRSRRRAAGG